MKKFLKILLSILSLYLIINIFLIGFVSYHFLSCLEGANITFKNIINNEITQEQYEIILSNVRNKTQKIADDITNLFTPKINYSAMPEVDPFPTLDDIFNDDWLKKQNEFLEEGLYLLNKSEEEFSKARQQGIEYLNQMIR